MFTKKERKVVVVTGASAGIGRAAALLFGRKKYSVGLIARNKDRLESLQKEIESKGGKAVCAFCDVADPDQVEEAARVIESALGPIDIWVNNAMVSILSLVRDMSPDEFKRVTDVTYLGYVYGTLCALNAWNRVGRGSLYRSVRFLPTGVSLFNRPIAQQNTRLRDLQSRFGASFFMKIAPSKLRWCRCQR